MQILKVFALIPNYEKHCLCVGDCLLVGLGVLGFVFLVLLSLFLGGVFVCFVCFCLFLGF